MRQLWAYAVLAFAIDQGSKYWVFEVLKLWDQGRIEVWPPLLVFTGGINTGVNFGLFSDGSDTMRYVLIGVALALCAGLLYWARSFDRPIEFASAGLIIGGALANVLDRILHPGVLDFLNMSCCGITNPYVFNLADVFIFAGAFGLILFQGGKNDA